MAMAVHIRKFVRKRLIGERFLVITAILGLGYVGICISITFATKGTNSSAISNPEDIGLDNRWRFRKLLQTFSNQSSDPTLGYNTTAMVAEVTTKRPRGQFPPEMISQNDLNHGAIVLHIIGVIYMFVALAIVCDEFFVPSLEVIIDKFKISEDVAGATFMAAGGSSPELFTSFIGVFAIHSDVGIGTIVGSAVFNILFVIGMCAIVSEQVLTLTWWPLFRDVFFYSISLAVLIAFFLGNKIYWWEALFLILIYIVYVIFMKFNHSIEAWVKSKIPSQNRVRTIAVRSTDNLIDDLDLYERGSPSIRTGTSNAKFRHGVLQLLIHTIDPLGEAKVHEKALRLHAVATLKLIYENGGFVNKDQDNNPTAGQGGVKNGVIPAISNGIVTHHGGVNSTRNFSQQTNVTTVGSVADYPMPPTNAVQMTETTSNHSNSQDVDASSNDNHNNLGDNQAGNHSNITTHHDNHNTASNVHGNNTSNDETDPGSHVNQHVSPDGSTSTGSRDSSNSQPSGIVDTGDEPLDMSWPDSCRKRFTYTLVAPILIPLWLTLPDVRRPEKRKWFPWTFLGSIFWIAIFAYLMNWWAATIGLTAGISDAVMGLTFLAAGTSIPDLITSIIVAKKGFGDMAVSSSVGSNIFDVTVGLPLPWLIYGAIYGIPYQVDSKGLVCSISLLVGMLLLVILMIGAFKWRLNKPMGVVMLFSYLIFLAVSVLLELGFLDCPFQV